MKKTLMLCLLGLFIISSCADDGLSTSDIAAVKALPLKPYKELDAAQKATAKKLMLKALEAMATDDLATARCSLKKDDSTCVEKLKPKIKAFRNDLKDDLKFDESFKDFQPLYVAASGTLIKKVRDFLLASIGKNMDQTKFNKLHSETLSEFGITPADERAFNVVDKQILEMVTPLGN